MEMVVISHDNAYELQMTKELGVTMQKWQIIGSIANIIGYGCKRLLDYQSTEGTITLHLP
jgi:hypothetical protein